MSCQDTPYKVCEGKSYPFTEGYSQYILSPVDKIDFENSNDKEMTFGVYADLDWKLFFFF